MSSPAMPENPMNQTRTSSPISTGGAGTFFEQHVNACWLSLLLVRAIPPIIRDCAVTEVHFQTERLGWKTDDFLVVGENGAGGRRKLVGQVKRSFTVSSGDEQCKRAITDFWRDFNNRSFFSPESDRFALVTLRGTNTLLENLSSLLDCARAARDGTEFEQRLRTPGFLNAKAHQYASEIKTIIEAAQARTLSDAELWPFLRVLHVLSFDLSTSTRQTETWVRSLLAYTATGPDRLGAADVTWNALLAEVGEGTPEARSYKRSNLPDSVLKKHSCIETRDEFALNALKDHSFFVFKNIKSTIGNKLQLPRVKLVQSIVDQLNTNQVVLISGPAGSGKSGAAKAAVEILAADRFVFGFRAEVFGRASLDETLLLAQIPTTARTLGAVLAGQDQKLLLVESIERLLEASTRDAFADLLTLMAEDGSWRLLLTCRDYSTDLVRSSFLESAEVVHSMVEVPPLDDSELEAIATAYPRLARPLSSAPLRRLLRNPYVVDKARLISWSDDRPLPESEREFRELFWRDIIRAESRARDGMPSRRGRVFTEVSMRRARALSLYASCCDLDPAALNALRSDSLISRDEESDQRFAPAHDVLEDWAILHWIEDQYSTNEESAPDLSAAIGGYPAIRRSYRKWVGELVERAPEAADRLFLAVLDRSSLSNHFRDDTLAAVLRSRNAAKFLERHHQALFADGKSLLRRVIHLLRVACVAPPAWLGEASSRVANLFAAPDGPAWAAVLRLVGARLNSFSRDDDLLLLGLIEDWSRGVSWWTPYPDGADDVVRIAHELLPNFADYRSDQQRRRTLTILAKLPLTDVNRFEALLMGAEGNRPGGELREIVLERMEGVVACRDVPEIVVAAAREQFFLTEAALTKRSYFGGSLDLEPAFGIRAARGRDFLPPSALRGPFLALLKSHPKIGLDLLVALFNHSVEWYAQGKTYREHVEPSFVARLTFSDGSTRTQWYNSTLWNLYRGTSGGPYVLQCALMALERWLFEVAEADPGRLDSILMDLLRRSDSGALSAVVASLVTAHPHRAGEALLILLGAKEYVLLDRGRLVSEFHASILARINRLGDPMDEAYLEERQQADARPHRRYDLEAATLNLQLGPLADRVQAVIDRHRADLPSADQQTEHDRIWRLALHRMDLRQYTVERPAPIPTSPAQSGEGSQTDVNQVVLNPNIPEPDLREMVSHNAENYQKTNARLGLLVWGVKVFRGEDDASHDPSQWRDRLEQAREVQDEAVTEGDFDLSQGGPGFVAAVCARDHWEELSDEDKDWCVDRICLEVERTGDSWDQMSRVQRTGMACDRTCARTLPSLLGRSLPDQTRQRVIRALVVALTHPAEEVRWYASGGIGAHLWSIDPTLAIRCVNALAMEANLAQAALDEEFKRSYPDRAAFSFLEADIARQLRIEFVHPGEIPLDALAGLDPSRSVAAEAYGPILCILSEAPKEPVAIEAFKRASRILVNWWDSDHERHGNRRNDRSPKTESAIRDLLVEFLFQVAPEDIGPILDPILEAINVHPREVSWLLLAIIGAEDRRWATERFWLLWQLFADRVRSARWLATIDDRHSEGGELLTVVLLGSSWKEGVRHWRSLEGGHASRVHALFEALPTSSTVTENYLGFLYHIGEQELPSAFLRLARLLEGRDGARRDASRLLRSKNSIYMLETLLRRHVYSRPLGLKRSPELRKATLKLLDALVEVGSSAAFRMRDDFVTPLDRP